MLPFQSLVYTPAAVYLEQIGRAEAVQLIALQWGRAIALWFGGKGMWRWAVRKITIHGG